MSYHRGQISNPATTARLLVFVNAIILYSLAYDAADVMDDDSLATALTDQIQVSTALIGMVRKPSVKPLVLAMQWGMTPKKAQKTFQATTWRRIWTVFQPSSR